MSTTDWAREDATCARCLRTGKPWVDGWEGNPDEWVCPNCQYADWHPHCTSVSDGDGERVDTAGLPSSEWIGVIERCEYIDLTVTVDMEGESPAWTCPRCGGTAYELVHEDYCGSGLSEAEFDLDLRFIEEDES